MSILFVLLTFIVVMTINYFFRTPAPQPAEFEVVARPRVPVLTKDLGFTIPKDYGFHPGHAWVLREGADNARVGLDSFAADLIGKIDKMEIISPGRWVRQGQPLVHLDANGVSFDVLSPIEGVVMAINKDVVDHPELASNDPYKDGWIAMMKSPDLPTNEKNLLQGSMVAPWMHYNVSRLNSTLSSLNPALAQDGGLPLGQVMSRVEPPMRQKLVKEFFLN